MARLRATIVGTLLAVAAAILAACSDADLAPTAPAVRSAAAPSAPTFSEWAPADGATLPQDPVLQYKVSSPEALDPASYRFTVNGEDWRSRAAPPTLSADGRSMVFWSNVVGLPTGQPMTFRVTYCTKGGVCTLRSMGYNGAPTGVGDSVTTRDPGGTAEVMAWGPDGFGIAHSHLFWGPQEPARRIMDDAATMGARWLRATVYWYLLQPQAPDSRGLNLVESELARLDTLVQRADRRGMKVVLIFEGTPDWARPGTPAGAVNYAPSDEHILGYHSMVRAVVSRLPKVHHWSPWNEPNSVEFLQPHPASGRTRVQAYERLLEYAADAIRSRAGNRVVGPDLAAIDETMPAAGDDMRVFLRDVLFSHSYAVDIIGVHHYNTSENVIGWVREIPGILQSPPSRLVRGEDDGRPLPQKEIWLTEFNFPEHGSEQQMAGVVRDVLGAMQSRETPQWTNSFVYQYDRQDGHRAFRMVDRDENGHVTRRLPSWTCFNAVAKGRIAC